MNDLVSLSIVIPILSTQTNVDNLTRSIENFKRSVFDFQIVVTIDNHKGDIVSPEIEALRQREGLEFYLGHFGSPGAARNFGVAKSNKDWIWFVDSDDIANPSNLASSLSSKNLEGVAIIVGQYIECRLETNSSKLIQDTTLDAVAMNPGIWRHLFKRVSLPVDPFPNFRMGEDQHFLARCYSNSSSVLHVQESIYTYFTGGLTNLTSKSEARNELFQATREFRSQFIRGVFAENVLASRMYTRQVITILKYLKLRYKMISLSQFLWTCLSKPSLSPNASSVVLSLLVKNGK